jgi:beta-galactosidase
MRESGDHITRQRRHANLFVAPSHYGITRRHFLALLGGGLGVAAIGRDAAAGPVLSRPPWPNRAYVRRLGDRPMLFVNDAPVPPIAYMSYLGGTALYREVADLGIHLYCFPAYLGDRGINTGSGIGPFRDGIWKGNDEFDFSSIGMDFGEILGADPYAHVVIRLHLDPPEWWERAHPEGCCQLPDGTTFRQCFSSKVWRDATTRAFLRVLDWLQVSPYAKHIVGVHVAAGFTEEWFYHFRGAFYDENPARTEAFRKWLDRAYNSNESLLREAWRSNEVTFSSAIPADISGAFREETWMSKEGNRPRFDTLSFHTETMVENIAWFCRLVKEHSDDRLLTGAFYGYHYFVTDARRGHGALGRLLACPYLDYLSSPNVYNRVMGEDWPPMVAVASVQRHGKLWLAENDTRTFKTTPLKERAPDIAPPGQYEDGVWMGPTSAEDSVALLRKNTARMLAYGYGGWWFDMWGGWFSDPQLLAVLQSSRELSQSELSRRVSGMEAQVAVVVDEALAFQDGSFGRLADGILANRSALGKIGTSYDLLLRDDLEGISETEYRFVWLMGIPALRKSEEALLHQCLGRGAHILHTGFNDTVLRRLRRPDIMMESVVRFSPSDLSALCREAGVHIYIDADDVVYARNGWLGIHSVKGGRRRVYLPFAANVADAFSREILGKHLRELDLHILPRTTTLLHVQPV